MPVDKKKVSTHRAICEVHREIYDELIEIEGTEEAIERLKEAYEIGLWLHRRLCDNEYGGPTNKAQKVAFVEKYFKKNHRYEESKRRRDNRGRK